MLLASPSEMAWLTNDPVHGESLAARLAEGALSAAEALEVALEIGGVLQSAHARGFFHGSVMPRLIRFAGSRARLIEPSPPSAVPLITPYSSPEQCHGAPPEARSDIWAFGAVLYEMVSGWPAFSGDTPEELRRTILETEPVPLSVLTAGSLPASAGSSFAALEGVISGCLTKELERRRQRIQNALIELKLIARPLARAASGRPRSSPAPPARLSRVAPISNRPGAEAIPWPGAAVPAPGPALEPPAALAEDVPSAGPGAAGIHIAISRREAAPVEAPPDESTPAPAAVSAPAPSAAPAEDVPSAHPEEAGILIPMSRREAAPESAPSAAPAGEVPSAHPEDAGILIPMSRREAAPEPAPPAAPAEEVPSAHPEEAGILIPMSRREAAPEPAPPAAPAEDVPSAHPEEAGILIPMSRREAAPEPAPQATPAEDVPSAHPEEAGILIPISRQEAAPDPVPPATPAEDVPSAHPEEAGILIPMSRREAAPAPAPALPGGTVPVEARPAPAADFISPEALPLAGSAQPIAEDRPARREPRLARLLPQLAPTLQEDFSRPPEPFEEPSPPGSPAAPEAAAYVACPEAPAEEAAPVNRVRPVEPSPRPAALLDLRPAYQPGEVTYSAGLRRRFWILAGLLLLVAVCAVAAIWRLAQRPGPRVFKFAVPPPEHTSYPGTPAVSPDGRLLVFSAVGPEGKRMLWLRPLDALHATVIAGSEGGFAPFWSPDSRYIAFFADRSLRKVLASGGTPQAICDVDAMAGGGSWNASGVILLAPSQAGGLVRVPDSGGRPEPVTALNDAKRERAHLWPRFLPDGKRFIFYGLTDFGETSGIYAGSVDGGEARRLLTADTNAVYSAGAVSGASTGVSRQGYLLFVRNRNLYGQTFDASSFGIDGGPVLLAEEIGAVRSLGLAPISASDNGVLVYQTVGKPTRQLLWFDRSGRQVAALGEPSEYGPPRISPDGKSVLVGKIAPGGENADVWLVLADGSARQLTDTPFHEGSPVWSPDGSRFAYFSNRDGAYDVYLQSLAGGKPELIVHNGSAKYPNDWSADGRYVLFGSIAKDTKSDLWVAGASDRRARPLLETVDGEGFGAFSPDGKWVAFQSDVEGRVEVYVQPFRPEGGSPERTFQVSRGGGGLPRWRNDGKEIFFITAGGRMMAAPVRAANGVFESEPARALFQTRPIPDTWNLYDATADGQRFLVNVPLEWSSAAPITVVTNWTEKLRR